MRSKKRREVNNGNKEEPLRVLGKMRSGKLLIYMRMLFSSKLGLKDYD